MVTLQLPQYDEILKNIVAYILKKYPIKDELSKARLTKIVYLVDWRAAFDYGKQITNIKWYFDNYGPFVHDIENMAQDLEIFEKMTTRNYFGNKKQFTN